MTKTLGSLGRVFREGGGGGGGGKITSLKCKPRRKELDSNA